MQADKSKLQKDKKKECKQMQTAYNKVVGTTNKINKRDRDITREKAALTMQKTPRTFKKKTSKKKGSELGEVAQLDSEDEAGVGRRASYGGSTSGFSFSYSACMGNRAGNDEEEDDDLGEA